MGLPSNEIGFSSSGQSDWITPHRAAIGSSYPQIILVASAYFQLHTWTIGMLLDAVDGITGSVRYVE